MTFQLAACGRDLATASTGFQEVVTGSHLSSHTSSASGSFTSLKLAPQLVTLIRWSTSSVQKHVCSDAFSATSVFASGVPLSQSSTPYWRWAATSLSPERVMSPLHLSA